MMPQYSRREMIQSLCGGLGSIGLTGMLSGQQAQAATLGHYTGPSLADEGETRHLPVHDRRPIAGRHVRSEARAAQVSGAAAELGRSSNGAADRRPAAEPVRVQAGREERR